ncbi:MAG: ABC transporter permease [Bryobacteraceae bacterium]
MRRRLQEWLAETHGTRFELLRHFLTRFFDNDLVPPGAMPRVAAGALALTASLWIILARVLAFKYSEMVRLKLESRYRAEILADQTALLLLAMCATALLAAALWQSLYPALRDYLALAGLPVRPAEIFTAKFTALLMVFVAFVLVLALPAAVVFQLVTATAWMRYPSAAAGIASSFTAIAAGSSAVFFGLIALQGLLLNALPGRVFERVSLWIQALLVAGALGALPFVLSGARLPFDPAAWRYTTLGGAIAPVGAFLAYRLSYHRYRRLLLEAPLARPAERADYLMRLLDLWIKDPREQAAFAFLCRTIARSRVHRMVLFVYAGFAIAWILKNASDYLAEQRDDIERLLLSSVPLTLACFALFGLRYLFSLPAERRANWIFQIAERDGRGAWLNAVERFVLCLGVAPMIALGGVAIAAAEGFLFGAAWALLAFLLCAAAFEFLFRDWRKMPFTCSYLPGKRPLALTLVTYLALLPVLLPVGFVVIAGASNPAAFVIVLGLELALWTRLRRTRLASWGTYPLKYEEEPDRAVESIGLSTEGTTVVQEHFQREWSDYLRAGPDIPVVRPLEPGETWLNRLADWVKDVPGDLRQSLRAMRKSPAFALTAVLTLGLGLGLNVAFFAVFNAFVLRPLAVRDPHSLVSVDFFTRDNRQVFLSRGEFESLRRSLPGISEVVATDWVITGLDGRPAKAALVSANYFSSLGAGIQRGRPFAADDSTPVVVLSHQAWQKRYGGADNVIGRSVLVRGYVFEVIGVAAREFTGLEKGGVDLWTLIDVWNEQPGLPRGPVMGLAGRLRPGVSVERAQAMAAAAAIHATAGAGQDRLIARAKVESKAVPVAWTALRYFIPFLVAFGLTMAIPCANAANMMLARAMTRQREIGVRLSLGASRGRVVRQLLTEGLVIAVVAGLAGLVLARAALHLAVQLVYETAPPAILFMWRLPELALDVKVFLYMMLVACLTTALFALAPAAQATRPAALALRGEFGTFRVSRLRDALVAGQVAVCVMLLVAAGVLVRGSGRLASIELGYDPRGVHAVGMGIAPLMELRSSLERSSWVDGVASMAHFPSEMRVMSAGTPGRSGFQPCYYNFVSGEYFRVMRMQLLRGRTFTVEQARSETAVAVVSEAAARMLWPGEEVIGKTILIRPERRNRDQWRPPFTQAEVIGVTGNIVMGAIGGVGRPSVHFPAMLRPEREMAIVLRARGDPDRSRGLLDAVISATPGSGGGWRVVGLQEAVDWDTYPQRAAAWLSTMLGGLALLLTATGMYGVLSYLVSQRTREIGVRIAVGATRADVARFILRYSARLAGAGLALGGVLALGLSKYFASTMGTVIDVYDVVSYSAGLGVAAMSTLLAALGPARRASQVDPMNALRAN